MSIERIVWLVLGAILIIWAIVMLFSDEPRLDQDEIDIIQTFVLGGLSLGLAAKSR
jgi:RsiW-degrading membrane proteinase PrsW (M82 family)